MKLAKVLPAMAALVVLSACASDAPKMENKAEQMATPTVTDKTVVYTCNKKTVTAVYQFENQEPTAAMVMVGNKVIAKDLLVMQLKKTSLHLLQANMFGT